MQNETFSTCCQTGVSSNLNNLICDKCGRNTATIFLPEKPKPNFNEWIKYIYNEAEKLKK